MSNIIEKLKFIKKSFKYELIFYNVILITLPLIVTSIVSYTTYRSSLFNEVSEYNLKITNQLSYNIDMYLEDMVAVSILSMYDKDIQRILKRKGEFFFIEEGSVEMYSQERLKNFLFMLKNLRTEIDGVFIYDNYGKVYYSVKGTGISTPGSINEEYDYRNSDWYRRAKRANGKSVIIETHFQEQMKPGNKKVFSIAKIIKDINYGNEIGSILIDVSLSEIDRICKNIIYSGNEGLVIFNNKGKVIYATNSPSDNNLYKSIFDKVKDKEYGSCINKYYGKEYLMTFTTSRYSTWKIVKFDSVKELLSVTNFIKKTSFIILAISLFLTITLLYFMSNKISLPIHKMREKMKMVESGNLDVQLNLSVRNEIGELGDSFNKMILRLKELVHRVYEVQLQNKEAQLIALQSQINPHFLYNTLDSIHMMAEINEDYEVSKMITSLGKMLRYSIKAESDPVKIRDEIEHVKNYVKIQQVRYEDEFKFFTDINKELEDYEIVKLTLQPLVENSIYHGIKGRKNDCYIMLNIEKKEKNIIIKVIDNGVGISEKRLETVRYQIDNYDNDKHSVKKSIGISNVNKRIKTYYGKEYGLTINSRQGIGTEVQVVIPAVKSGGN